MAYKKKLEQFKSGIFSLGTNFGELAQLLLQMESILTYWIQTTKR